MAGHNTQNQSCVGKGVGGIVCSGVGLLGSWVKRDSSNFSFKRGTWDH